MTFAVCFTNFGPYHLARLNALGARLGQGGDRLIAYEVAGRERTYPWDRREGEEGYRRVTLFPDRELGTLRPSECVEAIVAALDRDEPDAVGCVGYARPESMAAARWARRRGRPAILMFEGQAVDRTRIWPKELVKRRRVALFDAGLVGGPSHRDYLVRLGMPEGRIASGYNAVDNAFYRESARRWRGEAGGRAGLPTAPYFLSVCRFVPEKNLERLIEAFARYRDHSGDTGRWDLVLCGDGPLAPRIRELVARSGHAEAIHLPGFLQADELSRWYAFASAFVLPSLSEPWGLVVNEAASMGLPLLVSERAGCAATLVPEPWGSTGARFDPRDVEEMAHRLTWLALLLTDDERRAMGLRAAEVVEHWGPDRFAQGAVEALELARGTGGVGRDSIVAETHEVTR